MSLPDHMIQWPTMGAAMSAFGVTSMKALALRLVDIDATVTLQTLLVRYVAIAQPAKPEITYPNYDGQNLFGETPVSWKDPDHEAFNRVTSWSFELQGNDGTHVVLQFPAKHAAIGVKNPWTLETTYQAIITPENPARSALKHPPKQTKAHAHFEGPPGGGGGGGPVSGGGGQVCFDMSGNQVPC